MPFAGNPNQPQNTGSYDTLGVTTMNFDSLNKIGSTYYAMGSGDTTGTNLTSWRNILLYTGTGPTAMTENSALNPIITATPGSWDDWYLLHPKIVKIGSTYNCYYSARDASGNFSIGVAQASSITGPYTKYVGNPIIPFNGTHGNPQLPHIITVGATLFMYTSLNGNSGTQVVYWTSPANDGLTWTFGGIALDTPIIGVDWDSGCQIIDPFVFKNSHGFYEMAYTAETNFGGNAGQHLGYAISADAVNWYKYNAAPILSPNTAQSGTAFPFIGDPVLVQDGTTFTFLFDVANGFLGGSQLNYGLASTMADH